MNNQQRLRTLNNDAQTNTSPPQPAMGVAAVLVKAGQVLLIERGKPPAEGLWSIPGGRLEAGESLIEACQREVKEETGLDIVVKSLLAVVEHRDLAFHYVIHDFLAVLAPDSPLQPVAASDVRKARWVAVSDMATLNLVPGLESIIQQALTGQKGLAMRTDTGTDFW
ncbi:MAG: NUDIX hydrolase [Methylococcales bacterium]|nr:NUDIX hydrolase [Methylococcales bacterium]